MLCRRKLTKARRRIRRLLLSVCCIILIGVVYFEMSVKTQMSSVIVEEMQHLIETAVIDSAAAYFNENAALADHLIDVHTNDGGEVTAITTDPFTINTVKTEVSKRANAEIDALCEQNGVRIQLGSLSGLVLLSEVGPAVTLPVSSKQTVRCSFESTFESGGVNQTVHHITMNVHTEATVYNPFRIRKLIEVDSSFEIAQTVIVGSVPSTFGNFRY